MSTYTYDFSGVAYGNFERTDKPDPAFPDIGFRNNQHELLFPSLGFKLTVGGQIFTVNQIEHPFIKSTEDRVLPIDIVEWLHLPKPAHQTDLKLAIIDTGYATPKTPNDFIFAGECFHDYIPDLHGAHVDDISTKMLNCQKYRAKVGDEFGNMSPPTVLCAILWAIEKRANICSVSLGIGSIPEEFGPALEKVCAYATEKHCVIFASVGNLLDKCPETLSQMPGVVAVNGYYPAEQSTVYRDYGGRNCDPFKIDCAAPVPIATKLGSFGATSAATIVAASAALILWSKKGSWEGAKAVLFSDKSNNRYISYFLPKGVYQ
jgi:hypothetical protein